MTNTDEARRIYNDSVVIDGLSVIRVGPIATVSVECRPIGGFPLGHEQLRIRVEVSPREPECVEAGVGR